MLAFVAAPFWVSGCEQPDHKGPGLGVPISVREAPSTPEQAVARDRAAVITSATARLEIEQGSFATIQLSVTNRGRLTWTSIPPGPVNFSYHLLDREGKVVSWDQARTAFPQVIAPGETTTLTLKIGFEVFPGLGDYRLEFDLVQEGKTWFGQEGSPTLIVPVTVTPPSASIPNNADLAGPQFSVLAVAGDPAISQLWRLVQNTLAYTHDVLSIEGRRYEGFVAGGGYPQLWARDSATAMLGSRWFYSQPALRDWMELLLLHQRPDGSIPDWVNARNETDKNTVETDQETSLVIGAGLYYRLAGDANWLTTSINGHPLIDRVTRALDYVWQHRRDPTSGLVVGAHTIDWGDVELGECTQDAIYAGPSSLWTIDIYDQAMFVLAARELSVLQQASGHGQSAETWRQRAESVATRSRAQFWQPRRGYFRMHRHLGSYDHTFDEDAMFAMGGNAVAILAGIATPAMAERIFTVAHRRQAEYDVSTISGVLLPPYPDGVYCHPTVKQAWQYQNGGQWDWFGARLIMAMYGAGYSDAATAALRQIARKNVAHQGIHEWDDRAGNAKGSPWYSGSAGVLSRALVEGYFGIDSQYAALTLRPRLKDVSARIALREPATGRRIAYDYLVERGRLRLSVTTDHPAPVAVVLTTPSAWRHVTAVTINDRPVRFRIGQTGLDRWLSLSLPPATGPNVVEIKAVEPGESR